MKRTDILVAARGGTAYFARMRRPTLSR